MMENPQKTTESKKNTVRNKDLSRKPDHFDMLDIFQQKTIGIWYGQQ